jgi:hypothetical protein
MRSLAASAEDGYVQRSGLLGLCLVGRKDRGVRCCWVLVLGAADTGVTWAWVFTGKYIGTTCVHETLWICACGAVRVTGM